HMATLHRRTASADVLAITVALGRITSNSSSAVHDAATSAALRGCPFPGPTMPSDLVKLCSATHDAE
ncbi:MAG: hypothetical protein ACRDTC_15535, partial [Pseudonocardiaceae bacterium]